MTKSFLSKLLSGILFILIFTIILQNIFQRSVYPSYFKRQIINNIEQAIEELPTNATYQESLELLEDFTDKTQTSTTVIDLRDFAEGLNSIPYIIIEDDLKLTYKIFLPRLPQAVVEGTEIRGTFYKSKNGDFYLPIELFFRDRMIYGGPRMGMNSQTDYLTNNFADTSVEYEISGEIKELSVVDVKNTEDVTLNRELINISTGNYTMYKQLDTGIRYVSTDVDGNDQNLVYVTRMKVAGVDKTLLTIYPLNNIDYITSEMSRFNFILFGLAATFIIITFSIFSRRVSKPLLAINEATKKFANFEFTQIPEVDTDDEIGNLSRNINVLSTNLQATLTDLQEKNQALSSSLELESNREQTRKDFVEGISHELKTPLAVMQATNEALSLGLIPEEDLGEYYETIKNEIYKSNKIIQDMMSVYKIDQADYMANWTDCNLKDLIIDSLQSHEILANNKSVEFQTDITDTLVKADADKLLIVLNNFISNAIKYAPNNSRIQITSKDGYFAITNDGEIPKDSIESVFEPFYRIDKARARQDGSTGLGLYIVKQILTQHQAEYGVTSEHYKVTFYFKLKADL